MFFIFQMTIMFFGRFGKHFLAMITLETQEKPFVICIFKNLMTHR